MDLLDQAQSEIDDARHAGWNDAHRFALHHGDQLAQDNTPLERVQSVMEAENEPDEGKRHSAPEGREVGEGRSDGCACDVEQGVGSDAKDVTKIPTRASGDKALVRQGAPHRCGLQRYDVRGLVPTSHNEMPFVNKVECQLLRIDADSGEVQLLMEKRRDQG